MTRILATTALVALTAVPVFAQTDTAVTDTLGTDAEAHETADLRDPQTSPDELIDRTVFVSRANVANGLIVNSIEAPADDWENMGSVTDVIMTADGDVDAVVLDVGGFFGIGSRQVSLGIDELTLVDEVGSDGEFFIVFDGDPAVLEERPELDRSAAQAQGHSFYAADNQTVSSNGAMTDEAGAEVTIDPDMQDDAATDPDFAQSPADDAEEPFLAGGDRTALTADDLRGTDVYDASGEHIGSISDIVLTEDGRVSDVIINVGGFLGIGSKPVAVAFDEIQLAREEGAITSTLRATTMITADQFDNMEAWDG